MAITPANSSAGDSSDDERDDLPPIPREINTSDQKRADFLLARYQAQLEIHKTQRAGEDQELETIKEFYRSLREDVYKSYLDVAGKQVDRALTRAQSVLTAASAIGTVYGVALGVAFSASTGNRLFPPRGIMPGVCLGLAIVLSVSYLAYLTTTPGMKPLVPSGIGADDANKERDTFISWTNEAVKNRSMLLHMAVISLGWGVAFLPLPFLNLSGDFANPWVLALLTVSAVTILLPVLWWAISQWRSPGAAARPDQQNAATRSQDG